MSSTSTSSPPKKRNKTSHSLKEDLRSLNFKEQFEKVRLKTSKSILEFEFNENRVRILSTAKTSETENIKGIVYWMSRDCRVQDNWALLFGQRLALNHKVPLHVCFCLVPTFLDATIRQYKFLLNGLKEVEQECSALNLTFHLLIGSAATKIPNFVEDFDIGAVVCDFSPLRVPLQWVDDVVRKLPKSVPLFQVDAHNIVPVWETSDQQEYAARTIRIKIHQKLKVFLTDFPPVINHPYRSVMNEVNWTKAFDSLDVDMTVDEVSWAKPGYSNGVDELEQFCNHRLEIFNDKRNDPTINALSNLSPWFHFGQISVQRAILTVKNYEKLYSASVDAFIEDALVRRELSDNFCFYNKNYDSLNGLTDWAKKTLNGHKNDKRERIYTRDQLNSSQTHDDLWNSAQIQLRQDGKMHGFLRMYWAKKILEWTSTPEQALEIAIYFNDLYSLDGRDPNGYVGCMWAIGGIHDRGWKERSVFGTIRYMNYEGCQKKFDVQAFVALTMSTYIPPINDSILPNNVRPTVTATVPAPPNWLQSCEDTTISFQNYKRYSISHETSEYQTIINLLHPIQVIGINRIVNPDLWKRFVNTRTEMLRSKTDDLEILSKLGLDELEVIRCAHLALNYTKDPLLIPYSDNMVLLFHCTRKEESLKGIFSQGLDERLSAYHGGLLGKGIYFADDPMKSMQYDGTGCILIFAVLLGDCISVEHFQHQNSLVREPNKVKQQMRNCNDLFFDSIVARPAGYNEYVIYNRYQCCPIYQVMYNRSVAGASLSNVNIATQKLPPIAWIPERLGYAMPIQDQTINWPFFAADIFAAMGVTPPTNETQMSINDNLATLISLGFNDENKNREILSRFNNDLGQTIDYILNNKL